MAKISNTDYKENEWASKYHRILGRACYYSDIDQVDANEGSLSSMCVEYTYVDNKITPVSFTDWKYPNEGHISDRYSGIQLQITMADGLKIPFFIVVTYLDEKFPVKMYYVIPANQYANKYFTKCELPTQGAWMSLRKFSKFQHGLRGKPWNAEEEIRGKRKFDGTYDNEKSLIDVGLPVTTKLKDLSSQVQHYPLPQLQLSWLK